MQPQVLDVPSKVRCLFRGRGWDLDVAKARADSIQSPSMDTGCSTYRLTRVIHSIVAIFTSCLVEQPSIYIAGSQRFIGLFAEETKGIASGKVCRIADRSALCRICGSRYQNSDATIENRTFVAARAVLAQLNHG